MDAPLLQEMKTDLETLPGVVIRQTTQFADVAAQMTGICYERENRYKISAIPDGKHAIREHGTPGNWVPTGQELEAMPEMWRVQEESDLCLRVMLAWCGGLNLRALQLHFTERGAPRMRIQRPCRCGCCCCCPLEMTVLGDDGSMVLGKAEEDFSPYCGKCSENLFCGTYYTKVLERVPDGALEHKYTLRTSICCCGRVNNCCGATCCKNDLIMDLLDTQGKLVSTVQKTYAPTGGAAACCRMAFEFSNYIVEFPEQATAAQRSLILAGVFNTAFHLFERKGGDNNN